MKKSLFFITLFITSLRLSAQVSFNRAYHDHAELLHPFIVPIYSDYYFATQNNDGTNLLNFGKCYLYKHDKNGTLKFRQDLPVAGLPYVNAAFKTLDQKLLLIGTSYNCDVQDTSIVKGFIIKVDTNSNTLFYTTVSRMFLPSGIIDGFNSGLQYSDSSYFAFTDSVMYRFNKAGQTIYRNNLGFNKIGSCQLLTNGNILLSVLQGTNNFLVQVNTSGTIMSQYPASVLFSKMQYYDGQKIMGLGATKKIYRISNNFQLTDSSSFGANNKVKDFVCVTDSVYSINYNGNTQMYRISDTSFTGIAQSTTNLARMTQGCIIKNQEFVGVLSNCNSALSFSANNTFVSFGLFEYYASNNFNDFDVKVSSITADSVDCSYYTGNYYPKLRAKVWIKNVGPDNLSRVKLNCYVNTPALCGVAYWQKQYSGFSLNVGDSVQVTTDIVNVSYMQPGPMQNTISVPFCFYVTVPNDEADMNISNDGLCSNFIFSPVNVAGLKENGFDAANVEVFPNPFSNNITVRSDFPLKRITLLNSLGQIIVQSEITEKEIQLHPENIGAGIYFLEIKSEKFSAVKKVIKY